MVYYTSSCIRSIIPRKNSENRVIFSLTIPFATDSAAIVPLESESLSIYRPKSNNKNIIRITSHSYSCWFDLLRNYEMLPSGLFCIFLVWAAGLYLIYLCIYRMLTCCARILHNDAVMDFSTLALDQLHKHETSFAYYNYFPRFANIRKGIKKNFETVIKCFFLLCIYCKDVFLLLFMRFFF